MREAVSSSEHSTSTVMYLHGKGARCAVADMDTDALKELEVELKTRILVLFWLNL